jgi:hypothetical protein
MAREDTNLVSLGIKAGLGLIGLVIVLWVFSGAYIKVEPNEVVVKQDISGGALHVWDGRHDPGPHAVWWGTVTRYKLSDQLWFSAKEDEGKKTDDSIKVRFNDGGHGNISGSLRWMLPEDQNKMIALHQTYHSTAAIDHELIRQVVNKGVYMSGPLMSSRESYAEKRADLINYISDQIENGVYKTEHKSEKQIDPLTQAEKVVDIVTPKLKAGAPNGIEREEESPLQKFGLMATNITINEIAYDPVVEAQITQQQQAYSMVQQAIVNAKKAEQDTLTVEQQGKAKAAEAKWAQEVIKATEVTSAEKDKAVALTQATKDKEVAALALETAKLNAQTTVTNAKADSDAKRLAVSANNNLELRIEALKTINQYWATAYGAQRQVPDIVLGGSGTGGGMTAAMEAIGVKAARDLQVKP